MTSNLILHKDVHLGKAPARPNSIKMLYAEYGAALAPAPSVFGHDSIIKTWGMLGNDIAGDCVIAGGYHETIIWNKEAGVTVTVSKARALSTYTLITGYNPKDPNTDQGTDMQVAAAYRMKTGFIDSKNKIHKVDAYLAIKAKDLDNLANAAYYFGAVGVGIEFPESAMDQFNADQPWDVVKGAKIEGGHYVPLIGRRANGNFLVVTWGKVIEVTPAFLKKYNDENVSYVSLEFLKNNKSLEGFNLTQLLVDQKQLVRA